MEESKELTRNTHEDQLPEFTQDDLRRFEDLIVRLLLRVWLKESQDDAHAMHASGQQQ